MRTSISSRRSELLAQADHGHLCHLILSQQAFFYKQVVMSPRVQSGDEKHIFSCDEKHPSITGYKWSRTKPWNLWVRPQSREGPACDYSLNPSSLPAKSVFFTQLCLFLCSLKLTLVKPPILSGSCASYVLGSETGSYFH